jgi:NADH-quinone oxidoreductase subunit L
MIVPLLILAFFAVIAGFGPVAKYFLVVPHEGESGAIVPLLALTALAFGVGIAAWLYRNREHDPLHVDLLRHLFYIDDFYAWLIDRTQELLARIANFFDRWIIDAGAVRGASGGTFGIGSLLRLFQVGNLQAYAFLFGLGIVVLIYFTLFR